MHAPEVVDGGRDEPLGGVLVSEVHRDPRCFDPGFGEQRDESV